ncbi:jg14511 [Pararge aegeria aegeria]|uniref:Jg14511 protein n=1 Tax=Pararge aegeria aegeria TaxID=348720 RepID=A0A8S4S050_9NEOP|nr:jg14511 [Pararge aegeria aegeria]
MVPSINRQKRAPPRKIKPLLLKHKCSIREFQIPQFCAACVQELPETRMMSSVLLVGGRPTLYLPVAIPATWDPNIHPFSELCAMATSALQLVELCRKLFTTALEDVFKLLDWNGLGININGEYITQLRFADDVFIMAETLGDLNAMLNDLSRVSQQVGICMNRARRKIMSNAHVHSKL